MTTRIKTALIALPAILIPLPAFAQTVIDRSTDWHHGWDWKTEYLISGSLMMLLFWGGVIVAAVLIVRGFGNGSPQGTKLVYPGNKALDILQERFKRGEIDKVEFEERKRLLTD